MTKYVPIILATVVFFTLAACKGESGKASPAETDSPQVTNNRATKGNGKIGFSTITLGSEFFANLDEAVHSRFEKEGYTVITISCEGNAAKQVSDIENLITMECEAIFFFAVDPDAITDICKKARAAGIKVYGIACTIADTEAYDKIINTDQYASGVAAGEMAADWIEANFPEAASGSVEVALIIYTGNVDGNRRSNGQGTVSEKSSKIKVVAEYDLAGALDSNIKAQEFAEMMQSQYPDLRCIVTYGADSSLGANEVFMRDARLDRSKFAIFGVDTTEVVYGEIKKSITNDSLIRGTVSLGDDLSLNIWDCLIDADLQYMDENKTVFTPVKKITPGNIDDYVN
jgi:ABC-type sugar transport system substrate-binding protein